MKIKITFLLMGLVFLGAFMGVASAQAGEAAPKIAVVNFEPKDISEKTTITVGQMLARRGEQAWLSKAISDLIIKNLSVVNDFTVLEREKMQVFLNELGLERSGMIDQSSALRLGRVAKVNQVVYGNYELNGEQLSLVLFLLDLKTNTVLRTVHSEGNIKDLAVLVNKLVLEFLNQQNVNISEEQLARIRFQATDSIQATEHFYRGIDYYDRGEYADALAEFMIASQQDPQYRESFLWQGRMLEALKFYDHAVLEYQGLFEKYPQSVDGRDALYFAAELLAHRLQQDQRAIALFEKIATLEPQSAHNIEASFRLGQFYQQKCQWLKAFAAFQVVDSFRQEIIKDPDTLMRLNGFISRFKNWDHALSLYRDAAENLVVIYKNILDQMDKDLWPLPPRGVIVLDPVNSEFRENIFRQNPSLLTNEDIYPQWHEELYVVVIPPGPAAVGVDLRITGQVNDSDSGYSFDISAAPYPLPLDFDHYRFGYLAGQTKSVDSLKKYLSFHGKTTRLFAIHLLENHSRIVSWGVHVHFASDNLKPSQPIQLMQDSSFYEGKIFGKVDFLENNRTGTNQLMQNVFYQNKKEMDVLFHPVLGYVSVAVPGTLGGQPTDLWFTQSQNGKSWSQPVRLSVNSQSEDYNPRLVYDEDGKVRLAWISNRRGKGWELWMAAMNEEYKWQSSHRIVLEKFVDPGTENLSGDLNSLLEFDLYQDKGGRWIVAYYSYSQKSIVLLASSDSYEWKAVGNIPVPGIPHGLSLIQDSSGVYRLSALRNQGKIHLYSSNDLIQWQSREFLIGLWSQWWAPSPRGQRMRLFALDLGELLIIVSDNEYGLQYARFQADSEQPMLDLVNDADLRAYGITEGVNGNYIAGFKDLNGIVFREYQKFNVSGEEIKKDTRNWPIYMTTQRDKQGNNWRHIVAQSRRRISDVTSLGVEPGGRVWWGMETGMMYKDDEKFFATDVSQGFFNNDITDINACAKERVWFSSKELDQPLVGYVDYAHSSQFKNAIIDQAQGSIVAAACGDNGQILVGTPQGKVILFDGQKSLLNVSLAQPISVTALYYDPLVKEILIGTAGQGLYSVQIDKDNQVSLPKKISDDLKVIDVIKDHSGNIWLAAQGEGLIFYKDRTWQKLTPENSANPFWSVGKLAADAHGGVWFISDDSVESYGVGYCDGKTVSIYNPPHHILRSPSSLDVDKDGSVWIGSWFDGVYQMEPKK